MRWLNTDRRMLPFLADLAGIAFTNNAMLIAEYDNGIPIAVGIFDQFNGRSIHAHMWIATGRRPSRVWYWAMHDYPYWQLGVTNVVATVSAANKAMNKLAIHFGGKLVGTVPDYHVDGSDLLIYSGIEEDAPFWKRYKGGRKSPPTYLHNLQVAG